MGAKIRVANVTEYLGALGITERLRRTLVARLFDGKGHVAIASEHGIKPQSSRKRQWRARRLAIEGGLDVPLPRRSARPRTASL